MWSIWLFGEKWCNKIEDVVGLMIAVVCEKLDHCNVGCNVQLSKLAVGLDIERSVKEIHLNSTS